MNDSIGNVSPPNAFNKTLSDLLWDGADRNTLDLKTCKSLLDRGADPNAVEASLDNTSVLMSVVISRTRDKTALISLLLQYGANVNHSNNGGFTALHWACQHADSSEQIRLLLSQNPNLNLTNRLNRDVLDTALAHNIRPAIFLEIIKHVQVSQKHGAGLKKYHEGLVSLETGEYFISSAPHEEAKMMAASILEKFKLEDLLAEKMDNPNSLVDKKTKIHKI